MARWQLQEAKARLSEVVQRAERDGPQEITLRGRPAAVVISKKDFTRMTARKPSLVRFLRESPLAKVELRISRSRSLTRTVDL
jgi:prevent-host-death family protein